MNDNAENPLSQPIVSDETIATPLTREALYALAWSEPMLKLAARFGVGHTHC